MSALLEQFLAESREALQGIGEKVMQLEAEPGDDALMTALFRLVHTLKGNSGLFEFREMTRVLHAGEDLMDAVRHGRVAYSKELADRLLDAMDFVSMLCDEVESTGEIGAGHGAAATALSAELRALLPSADGTPAAATAADRNAPSAGPSVELPDDVRTDAYRRLCDGEELLWLEYTPTEECFFQGVDPFLQARTAPGVIWGAVATTAPWPALAELDAYRCVLRLQLLSTALPADIDEHFRYVSDQVRRVVLVPRMLAPTPAALPDGRFQVLTDLMEAQRAILALEDGRQGSRGRLASVLAALTGCLTAVGEDAALPGLQFAGAAALEAGSSGPLAAWLDHRFGQASSDGARPSGAAPLPETAVGIEAVSDARGSRRSDDPVAGATSLKVDQAKIDRLMNLIGEMVVSKNALPYVAARAETVYGVRELSREIKSQYAVINRIVEEMQDAIMQIRMMPVSAVFQRFPRLVRDTSRKLGKDVRLILEGEETEADKNIIEALADPLVHILRNSLDHGFELPEVRRASGKPPVGTLIIRASQQADRVLIEIIDDGKGIDPAVVKRKAIERGIIDDAAAERMPDQEAVNLVFAAGFSTMEVVSDLSGRGVGMDVVRTAVERVNGTVHLESAVGRGTKLRLSLPLSMAVTNVMIVESDGQVFGMPMDSVVETVRMPRSAIRTIKQSQAIVLRDRIVPLKAMNTLLGLAADPKANADDELAVLVVRPGDETVGLLVDDVHETVDIILKPMSGVLAGMPAYAGSALMGDGSVLMVLNVKEML